MLDQKTQFLLKQFSEIKSQITCTFISNDIKYQIPQSLITIQATINDQQLSQLINQILIKNNIIENQLSFQFLLNNEIIIGNIGSHLIKHNIQQEETIKIFYFNQITQPKNLLKSKISDWISCIEISNDLMKHKIIIVSLFNGNLLIFNQNLQSIFEFKFFERTIKAIKTFNKECTDYLICGGKDEVIKIFSIEQNRLNFNYQSIECNAIIECLDISPNKNYLASGESEGYIKIWKLNNKNIQYHNNSNIYPTQTKQIHQNKMSNLIWINEDNIITSSFDHSFIKYNIQKNIQDAIYQTGICITCMDLLDQNKIIAGFDNSTIKLYDLRESTIIKEQKKFKSHSQYISQIKFSISNYFIFASSSYDGSVKIWDIRSCFPLHNISQQNKIFALSLNKNQLIFGGQDQELNVYTLC